MNCYTFVFIDLKRRSQDIINKLVPTHIVNRFDRVEEAAQYISECTSPDILLIWHLSSSLYNDIKLEIDDIENAIALFGNRNMAYKIAVSDFNTYTSAARTTKWFKKMGNSETDLVFSWDGLKSFLFNS